MKGLRVVVGDPILHPNDYHEHNASQVEITYNGIRLVICPDEEEGLKIYEHGHQRLIIRPKAANAVVVTNK